MLTKLLADDIFTTKAMLFEELILDRDPAPRPGLVDFVTDTFAAGVQVAVVASGQRSWAEPLVRQLVGEGIVETVVTTEDVKKGMPNPEAHRLALWELGITAENALAVSGSASGLRAATGAGLATVVVTGEGVPDIPTAVAVRPDFGGPRRCRWPIANACTAVGGPAQAVSRVTETAVPEASAQIKFARTAECRSLDPPFRR